MPRQRRRRCRTAADGLGVAAAVYVVVIGALLVVAWRRRDPRDSDADDREKKARSAVVLGTAVTVAILFPLLIYDFIIARVVSDRPGGSLLSIRVIGHQ